MEGTNNLADFLPTFRLLDYGNLKKRLKILAKRTDGFLQGLNDEHRNAKQRPNTMIGHLLSLQESQPEYYADQIIKGLILSASGFSPLLLPSIASPMRKNDIVFFNFQFVRFPLPLVQSIPTHTLYFRFLSPQTAPPRP